jgi:hypothetical protein
VTRVTAGGGRRTSATGDVVVQGGLGTLGDVNWALLLFLGWTGAAIVAACIVVLLVRHRFNRYHRVDRSVATPAPVTAAIDPRAAGRLHRRLARAAHTAEDIADQHRPVTRRERRRAREEPEVVRLATEIKAHAVELDRRIALAARLAPAERSPEVRRLGAGVREVERAVADLARVSAGTRATSIRPDDRTGVAETRERIGHLAEAQGELDRVDADNGLVAPDPRGRPLPPPPPLPADADQVGRLPSVPPRPAPPPSAAPAAAPVRRSPADR